MRKNIIRAVVCAAGIALLFGITACKQFSADIDEELGYWARSPSSPVLERHLPYP